MSYISELILFSNAGITSRFVEALPLSAFSSLKQPATLLHVLFQQQQLKWSFYTRRIEQLYAVLFSALGVYCDDAL